MKKSGRSERVWVYKAFDALSHGMIAPSLLWPATGR